MQYWLLTTGCPLLVAWLNVISIVPYHTIRQDVCFWYISWCQYVNRWIIRVFNGQLFSRGFSTDFDMSVWYDPCKLPSKRSRFFILLHHDTLICPFEHWIIDLPGSFSSCDDSCPQHLYNSCLAIMIYDFGFSVRYFWGSALVFRFTPVIG